VRKTNAPYTFGPMSSRERRILHLALRDELDLKTESTGTAGQRAVVSIQKILKRFFRRGLAFRERPETQVRSNSTSIGPSTYATKNPSA